MYGTGGHHRRESVHAVICLGAARQLNEQRARAHALRVRHGTPDLAQVLTVRVGKVQGTVIVEQGGKIGAQEHVFRKADGHVLVLLQLQLAYGRIVDGHADTAHVGEEGAQRIAQRGHALRPGQAVGFQHIIQVIGKLQLNDRSTRGFGIDQHGVGGEQVAQQRQGGGVNLPGGTLRQLAQDGDHHVGKHLIGKRYAAYLADYAIHAADGKIQRYIGSKRLERCVRTAVDPAGKQLFICRADVLCRRG